MIVLEPAASGAGRTPCVIALFGVGLIGTALLGALRSRGHFTETQHPIRWSGAAFRREQLDRVEALVRGALAAHPGASLRVAWAAGSGGFGATEEDARRELETFSLVTDRFGRVAAESASARSTLVMLSSAGGLFEGQRVVDAGSQPSPRRPYGRLKLAQERLARAADAPWAAKIVRLTSVYGLIRPGHRLGLVSTLIRNGLRQQRTTLTGRMDTLRDFVWVEDVARHLAGTLLDEGSACNPSVETLASCRPSTLLEVQHLVNRVLGRSTYVSYAPQPSNEVDITFRPDVVPAGFEPSDLRANITRIHRDALQTGLALVREPEAPGRSAA